MLGMLLLLVLLVFLLELLLVALEALDCHHLRGEAVPRLLVLLLAMVTMLIGPMLWL